MKIKYIIRAIEEEIGKCSDYPKYYMKRIISTTVTIKQTVTEIKKTGDSLIEWGEHVQEYDESTNVQQMIKGMGKSIKDYTEIITQAQTNSETFENLTMVDNPWQVIVEENPGIEKTLKDWSTWIGGNESEILKRKGVLLDNIEDLDKTIRQQGKAKKPTLKGKKQIIEKIEKSDQPIYKMAEYCENLLNKIEEE